MRILLPFFAALPLLASAQSFPSLDRPPRDDGRQERPAPPADDHRPPPRGERPGPPREQNEGKEDPAKRYSLEQATSENAQLHTIAFNGLAYLTGDFALDTFLPPGKVSDYFGFQYLRDIDQRQGGHSTNFLTRIAHNLLTILDASQRAELVALAREQEADIRRFAELRLPLIQAFRRQLEGKRPAGKNLDREAVMRYSGELYVLDGKLAWRRAQVMAELLRRFTPAQRAALDKLKFGDSGSWPEASNPLDRRQLSHANDVAVMTYASEMFAWAKGSLEADTYFCPERHGMYFGGFGMKTAPAMGKQNYSISTRLTGDAGAAFLDLLNDRQRRQLTALPAQQQADLQEIVRLRRQIASELRRFLAGERADPNRIASLSRRYGELDGKLSWQYATAFANIAASLSPTQRQQMNALRQRNADEPQGPFLYSEPFSRLREAPQIGSSDGLFSR